MRVLNKILKNLFFSIIVANPGEFIFSQTLNSHWPAIITATQAIKFGSFCIKEHSGGTVTVNHDGSRSATGGIYLLGKVQNVQPAIFEVRLRAECTLNISFHGTTRLTGNRGGSLIMEIGQTDKGDNYSLISAQNDYYSIKTIYVGGTLHVPGSAIPGSYSGTFDITVNQE